MSNLTLLDTLDSFLSDLHSSLPPALQAYLTRSNMQSLLRAIIILSTYLLFRPHLESLFRKITGTPDKRQEEIKARLEFLKGQQQQQQNSSLDPAMFGGKIPLVNREGKIVKLVTPEEAEAMKKQQQQQQQHQQPHSKGTMGNKSAEGGRSGGVGGGSGGKKGRKKA